MKVLQLSITYTNTCCKQEKGNTMINEGVCGSPLYIASEFDEEANLELQYLTLKVVGSDEVPSNTELIQLGARLVIMGYILGTNSQGDGLVFDQAWRDKHFEGLVDVFRAAAREQADWNVEAQRLAAATSEATLEAIHGPPQDDDQDVPF